MCRYGTHLDEQLLAHVDVLDHEDLGAYVAVNDLALVHVLDRVHQLAGGT